MAMSTTQVDGEVVLLDIEGTVCPVSFVHAVLFPFALASLPRVLETQWNDPAFAVYRDAFPVEHRTSPAALLSHVQDLMSRDVKIAYLKSLQGYLWRSGYSSGAIVSPLYPDVQPSLLTWHAANIKIIIYSSGSITAQKLLFQYTNSTPDADLNPLIEDYFDTVNAGGKNEKGSYEIIARTALDGKVAVEKWLFLSDNVREVDAAKAAGMQAFVVVREGNAALSAEEKERNVLVERFDEFEVRKG